MLCTGLLLDSFVNLRRKVMSTFLFVQGLLVHKKKKKMVLGDDTIFLFDPLSGVKGCTVYGLILLVNKYPTT